MTLNELAKVLNEMYYNAPKGEAVSMIHLFGIKYAEEIEKLDIPKKCIIEQSKLPSSYLTELMKGIKLSKHVKPKI